MIATVAGTKGIAGEMTGTKGIIIAEIVAVAIGIVMIVTVANVVGEMVCRVNLGTFHFEYSLMDGQTG